MKKTDKSEIFLWEWGVGHKKAHKSSKNLWNIEYRTRNYECRNKNLDAVLQVVFFYFSIECSFSDAEDFSGLFTVVAGFCQRVCNGLPFQLVQ